MVSLKEKMACIQILSPALVIISSDISLPWKQSPRDTCGLIE